MVRICVWGDSITEGFFDEEGGWCDRLKRHYIKAGEDVSVVNLGISGNNTNDLLERFETEIRARTPEVVIFAIGVNDSQYHIKTHEHRVGLELFTKNLEILTNIAHKYTRSVIFVGLVIVDDTLTNPIPWDKNKVKCYAQADSRKYDETLQRFCEEHKLIYIDLSEVVGLEDLEDGLHPNTQGHKKMFERIRDELQKKYSTLFL